MVKIPSRNNLFERVKSLGKRYGGGLYDAAANFERARRKRVAIRKRQSVAATGYADFGAVVGAIFAELRGPSGTASVPSHDAFTLVAVVGIAGAVFALATGAAIPGRPRAAPRSAP